MQPWGSCMRCKGLPRRCSRAWRLHAFRRRRLGVTTAIRPPTARCQRRSPADDPCCRTRDRPCRRGLPGSHLPWAGKTSKETRPRRRDRCRRRLDDEPGWPWRGSGQDRRYDRWLNDSGVYTRRDDEISTSSLRLCRQRDGRRLHVGGLTAS